MPTDEQSDDAIFYPARCDCGHVEGQHQDGPQTSCTIPGCGCDGFAAKDDMA